MAKLDPQIAAHLEWIGFVRPTGLVVSAPALVRAGAILDRRDTEGQQLLRACVQERTFHQKEGAVPYISDFGTFASSVLGWSFSPKAYAGTPETPIPAELEVALPEYGDVLRPDFAVRELEPQHGCAWQLLVRVLQPGEDFDAVAARNGGLDASEHSRLDRLLRQTRVPAGVLFNGRALRLISAPYGESSGWIDFRVADMVQTAGRPISTALRLLLGQSRLLSLPRAQRFAALLHDSRKFQNEVSERLAEQVLHALYELLRGFQSAHDASGGELLQKALSEDPDEVYRSLLTVILRLVFLLYAEERDMLPEDETFLQHYSLGGLHERLREDAALFPDTMDLRYGAWAQLLVLFRMIHDGAKAGSTRLPRRHGVLFDPDRFPFLEGRGARGARQSDERIDPPLVPDGTIYRALEKLLVLDGERISYRALDVEQIGSVYETMMGFRLETATGRSVAIKAQKKQGAPTAVDLEELLRDPPAKRDKWIQDRVGRKITDTVKKGLVAAKSVEDLHAAILPVIDLAATPDLVPKGAMVLQPSEERRRSGSHYTPRELTEPIVRTTLEPILARLRGSDSKPPRAAEILELKVCDPAMGSGAFLVEACRQLGDVLVDAWHAHGEVPTVPPDEDELIFARRLVAQRCLYGVDRNPVAVDLAKVSLWLVTLARDHALTFLDHALRHGDSLVGLTRRQIEALEWEPKGAVIKGLGVRERVDRVFELRERIRQADDGVSDWELRDLWDEARYELAKVRLFGDLVLAAFFSGDNPTDRERTRAEYASAILKGDVDRYREWLDSRQKAQEAFVPFHWEIEFPEVFDRTTAGFDGIVGNPPFLGGMRISSLLSASYRDYLYETFEGCSNRADLVAFFYRRAFSLLRTEGALGFIATNTIAQGDTRSGGLGWICANGGSIYAATKRLVWPGLAAVIVSVVHIKKGTSETAAVLNGTRVPRISAFLLPSNNDSNPAPLQENRGKSYKGTVVLGMGFTFDDDGNSGVATPSIEIDRIIAAEPESARLIKPFIGAAEVVTSPTHQHDRYVIDFGGMPEEDARRHRALFEIVARRVKPERDQQKRKVYRERWWQFAERQAALYDAVRGMDRVLVVPEVCPRLAFTFVGTNHVYAQTLYVLLLQEYAALALLQARPHEIWARHFGSSMKDDLRYVSSDCFDTFPFPHEWRAHVELESAGRAYYDFRSAIMLKNNEGLTKIYNRFHNPHEADPAIYTLRELHAEMDRAVLGAYGWNDIKTDCEFLLDYNIDEDEWGDKRKPYRYRWPDDVRDEVLARLLELNVERAKAEARSGAAVSKQRSRRATAKRSATTDDTRDMFS